MTKTILTAWDAAHLQYLSDMSEQFKRISGLDAAIPETMSPKISGYRLKAMQDDKEKQ